MLASDAILFLNNAYDERVRMFNGSDALPLFSPPHPYKPWLMASKIQEPPLHVHLGSDWAKSSDFNGKVQYEAA